MMCLQNHSGIGTLIYWHLREGCWIANLLWSANENLICLFQVLLAKLRLKMNVLKDEMDTAVLDQVTHFDLGCKHNLKT